MKPNFSRLLLPIILAASTAHADYTGGAIVNENQTYTGDINIIYTKTTEGTVRGGAVELSGTEGSNKTTTLEGNITITLQDGEAAGTGIYIGDTTTDANIILKTARPGDRIFIESNVATNGILNYSSTGRVVLDASNSPSQSIGINLNAGGRGIMNIGNTEVIGNINVRVEGDGGETNYGLFTRGGGSITVTGKSDITAIGSGAIGIMASSGQINISDATTINSTSYAVTSSQGASITFGGSLDVTSAEGYGIYAVDAGSSVTLSGSGKVNINAGYIGIMASTGQVNVSGPATINARSHGIASTNGSNITMGAGLNVTSAEGHGIYAVNAGSTVTLSGSSHISGKTYGIYTSSGGSIEGAGQFSISGKIGAYGNNESMSSINLTLTQKSLFTGSAEMLGEGPDALNRELNLTLQDNSLWQVTDNSTLTNLTLGQGSALQFAFNGASLTDIISATGAITFEANSYIYLTGDLSGLEGSSFDFFDGTLVNNGVKFIGFDGTDWVEYEYTQTGANTFAFSASAPLVIEEPGFIPEPATATLGLLGLASLLTRRRRA